MTVVEGSSLALRPLGEPGGAGVRICKEVVLSSSTAGTKKLG